MHMARLSPAVVSTTAVLLALLVAANGQNYHYSNGWHPGKRDSATKDVFYRGAIGDDNCRFRKQVVHAIARSIIEELAKVDRGCLAMDTLNLKDILGTEPLNRAAEARTKLEEENSKW